jgi:hypothetical protein
MGKVDRHVVGFVNGFAEGHGRAADAIAAEGVGWPFDYRVGGVQVQMGVAGRVRRGAGWRGCGRGGRRHGVGGRGYSIQFNLRGEEEDRINSRRGPFDVMLGGTESGYVRPTARAASQRLVDNHGEVTYR